MGERMRNENEEKSRINSFFSDIPNDSLRQNVFASVVADAVCNGKSKAEIANILQFLQILSCLMKTYMF